MAGPPELETAAAPATILESEGTGRERGGRGDFIQVALGIGNEGEGGPPQTAMAAAIGARGELGSGRESEGR